MSVDPAIAWTLRVALAALFATAAFHKAADLAAFAATLRDYRMLPAAVTGLLAPCFAAAEALVAVSLLAPGWAGSAAAGGAGLLLVYTAAIATNLLRGRREIDCGCFGPRVRQSISGGLVARNAVLVAGAFVAALPAGSRPLVWVDAVTIVLGACVLALLLQATNALTLTAQSSLQRLRRST